MLQEYNRTKDEMNKLLDKVEKQATFLNNFPEYKEI